MGVVIAGRILIFGKTIGLSFQICEKFGPNLDTCPEGTILGLRLDSSGGLHLHVNGMDQGVAVPDVPQPCHALVDLYGQCEQVSGNGSREEGMPERWLSKKRGTLWSKEGISRPWGLIMLCLTIPLLQVTIVSPEPGAAIGKSAGIQGDMEKADMVDGEPALRDQDPTSSHLVLLAPSSMTSVLLLQGSRRVCAGVHRLLPAHSRAANTMPFAPVSRNCYYFLVSSQSPQNLPHSLDQCRGMPRVLEMS